MTTSGSRSTNAPLGSNRPFRYIQDKARSDWLASADLWAEFERSSENAIRSLGSSDRRWNTSSATDLKASLFSSLESVRLAAILATIEFSPNDPDLLCAIVDLIFDDTSARVRGTALRAAATLERTKKDANVLLSSLADKMSEQFQIEVGAIDTRLSGLWLRSVDLLTTARDTLSATKAMHEQLLEKNSRGLLTKMRADRAFAKSQLDNSDPSVRATAIGVLTSNYDPTPEILALCEQWSMNEHDVGVRIACVGALNRFFRKSSDPRIARIFAQLVRDDSSHVNLRKAAYEALFYLLNRPQEEWPMMREAIGQFSYPDDIDWAFVDSCLV